MVLVKISIWLSSSKLQIFMGLTEKPSIQNKKIIAFLLVEKHDFHIGNYSTTKFAKLCVDLTLRTLPFFIKPNSKNFCTLLCG